MRLPPIGRAELEILRYILDHHPISVREVAEHVAAVKGHTRTTVLNVMERLRQKGYLSRQQEGGIYRYIPVMSKPQMLQFLVGNFVEQALGGSLEPFMAYLTQDADVSEEELAELKQIVSELDSRRRVGPEPSGGEQS